MAKIAYLRYSISTRAVSCGLTFSTSVSCCLKNASNIEMRQRFARTQTAFMNVSSVSAMMLFAPAGLQR